MRKIVSGLAVAGVALIAQNLYWQIWPKVVAATGCSIKLPRPEPVLARSMARSYDTGDGTVRHGGLLHWLRRAQDHFQLGRWSLSLGWIASLAPLLIRAYPRTRAARPRLVTCRDRTGIQPKSTISSLSRLAASGVRLSRGRSSFSKIASVATRSTPS